jgi:hypothetical protein
MSINLEETLGQMCARVIQQQRTDMLAQGQVFTMKHVAQIIDQTKKQIDLEHTGKNVPPPPDAVTAYSASIGYPLDGQKWCDAYELKGWLVSGKTKMKDWKAAVRNWKASGYGQGTITVAGFKTAINEQKRDYTTI